MSELLSTTSLTPLPAADGEKAKTQRQKRAEDILARILARAESATDADRALVKRLIDRANTGERGVELVKMTPAAAAIIFLEFNRQNRHWNETISEGYSAQMANGQWTFHGQGCAFLISGDLGDGQHRLAGVALQGNSVEFPVTFGMTEEAIADIDSGLGRNAADYLGIVDKTMTEPKRKQRILKAAYAAAKASARNDEESRPYTLAPRHNRDVAAAIKTHEVQINEAIEIAMESVRGRSKPTYKVDEAAALCLFLLLKGWPRVKLAADLDVFQSGEDREGGNSPLFVVADMLQKSAAKRERQSFAAQARAVAHAFRLSEQGVKAARASSFKDVMKGTQPVDVSYPGATPYSAD